LIVFERQTGLDEVIQTGVALDATVTVELLDTISIRDRRCTTGRSSFDTAGWSPQAAFCR